MTEYAVLLLLALLGIESVATAILGAVYSSDPVQFKPLKFIATIFLGFSIALFYACLIPLILGWIKSRLQGQKYSFQPLNIAGLPLIVPAIVFELTHPTEGWLLSLLVAGGVWFGVLTIFALYPGRPRPKKSNSQIKPPSA